MKKIKIALIGAGEMGYHYHFPAISEFEDTEIVGLCDLNQDRLEKVANTFCIKNVYTNYSTMLDKTSPDAVYIITPPHILYDIVMDVLERKINMFIEKPPAVTSFQTRCMAKLAEENNLITAVGFQRRYHPLIVHCHKMVCQNTSLNQISVSYLKNMDIQKLHPYYRGAIDILHCDAIHAVDCLRFYSGLSRVKSVKSEVSNLDSWYACRFNAIIEFENGIIGILQVNWRTGKRFLKLEFHGSGYSAFVDADGDAKIYANNNERPFFESDCQTIVNSPKPFMHQGHYLENRAFINAIKTNTPLHNSLSDAVKTMELADQIYESASFHSQ